MLFLEWDVLDFGTAKRNGGKSSASSDPNVLDGVSYDSCTVSSVAERDEEDAVNDVGRRVAMDGSGGRCVLMKVEIERETLACGAVIAVMVSLLLPRFADVGEHQLEYGRRYETGHERYSRH